MVVRRIVIAGAGCVHKFGPEGELMKFAYRRAGAPTGRNEGMAAKLRAGGGKATLEDLGNDVFIAGTPDDVITGLMRVQEMTACDVVLGTPSGPNPDEACKLFTQEVMPVFAR
jgi:alkanesulfonate monooxygenase SsuD/methylene tetrahydromethanopterin reductase-like flavin-dependent oxidoreductase (luciferase family)